MTQKGYLTNLASEFHVLSALTRKGYDASLTLGNRKSVDITVVLAEGRALTIDVKAVAGKNDWLLGNSELRVAKNHFVALVGYEGQFPHPDKLPRLWIVPSQALTAHVKVAKNMKTRFISRKHWLTAGGNYEGKWELLEK